MGTQLPSPGHSPQFSAIVCCGQTAGWTKMPLGMEVGLGPGDFVFDCEPATHRKKAQPPHPIFGACLFWPNGWMKTPLGTEVDLGTGHIVLDVVPTPSCPRKGHSSPVFSPMSIVAMHGRRTELLNSCYIFCYTYFSSYSIPYHKFLFQFYFSYFPSVQFQLT